MTAPGAGQKWHAGIPTWVLGAIPLLLAAALAGAFLWSGGPGLNRNGIPVEDVAV